MVQGLEPTIHANKTPCNKRNCCTTKKKILGCIFAEKIVLEKGRVATSTFTVPMQFIINASEVLGGSKKKQEASFDLLFCLVPGAGLEPAQP